MKMKKHLRIILSAVIIWIVILIVFTKFYGRKKQDVSQPKIVNFEEKIAPELLPYGGTTRPKHLVEPEYPEEAKRSGIEGTVYLKIAIDTAGKVIDVKILKGVHELLDKAAVDAAWKSSYYPPKHEGKPASIWIGQPMTFRLPKEAKQRRKDKRTF